MSIEKCQVILYTFTLFFDVRPWTQDFDPETVLTPQMTPAALGPSQRFQMVKQNGVFSTGPSSKERIAISGGGQTERLYMAGQVADTP
jgi:hypothetical protein